MEHRNTLPYMVKKPGAGYRCICNYCWNLAVCGTSKSVICEEDSRALEHTKETGLLLPGCAEIVTLVVGAEQAKIKCHKVLLGLKSEYFDALCFGNFLSNGQCEFRMEDELPEAMSAFISWLYSGRVPSTCKIAPEVLWVLADRLRSPGFANAAMLLIFTRYNAEELEADVADYVYDNTPDGSKLRLFVRDLVLEIGPLGSADWDCGDSSSSKKDWEALIQRRGQLVADVALKGSFYYGAESDEPYMPYNHHRYLEPITTRPVEDFVEGKPRQGTRKVEGAKRQKLS